MNHGWEKTSRSLREGCAYDGKMEAERQRPAAVARIGNCIP